MAIGLSVTGLATDQPAVNRTIIKVAGSACEPAQNHEPPAVQQGDAVEADFHGINSRFVIATGLRS